MPSPSARFAVREAARASMWSSVIEHSDLFEVVHNPRLRGLHVSAFSSSASCDKLTTIC